MKALLRITSAIEVAAGLTLGAIPSMAVALLLGSPLDAPAAVSLGRLAGAALLALGIACWFAGRDAHSTAARGVVAGMVVYNFGAVLVLGGAGIQTHSTGFVLWSAVVLHSVMGGWCVASFVRRPADV